MPDEVMEAHRLRTENWKYRRELEFQAATIARLTAERDAAVRERDELREAVRQYLDALDNSTDEAHTSDLRSALAARPSSEEGGG